ncbi:KRI1-like family C-terminal-domain-containing protein [Dipodascopsis uninucleata]
MDSDDEDDGSNNSGSDDNFTINEAYAARFKHNKEREEFMRLQEKFKRGELDINDDEEDSETSEEEDSDAELLTEDIDQRINEIVSALKRKDTSVLRDPNVRFFDEPNNVSEEDGSQGRKEKPVFLKDYHRMSLLNQLDSEEKDGEDGNDAELPYARQLYRDRQQLVKEIHDEAGGNDEGDELFSLKKDNAREIEPIELPDPSEDPEKFLESFITSNAWREGAPVRRQKSQSSANQRTTEDIELQEDDSDFEEKAEQFETEHNFRFEAGEVAAQVVSYGRDTVNEHSVRKAEETTRQRARRLTKEAKASEKQERKSAMDRFRKLKIKETMDKLRKIREAAGLDDINDDGEGGDIEFAIDAEDLEKDFDENEWEEKMNKTFGENFYQRDATKPEWDDDIDIDDIVPGFSDSNPVSKLSKRGERKKKKSEKKKLEADLRKEAETIVDTDILPNEAPNRVPTPEQKFRYREVSPESFNLNPLDILLADDNQLNQYVGLKKLAPYRESEKKEKDHKRYAKKKRLREWRKQAFGSTSLPSWEEGLQRLQNTEGRDDGSSRHSHKKRKR